MDTSGADHIKSVEYQASFDHTDSLQVFYLCFPRSSFVDGQSKFDCKLEYGHRSCIINARPDFSSTEKFTSQVGGAFSPSAGPTRVRNFVYKSILRCDLFSKSFARNKKKSPESVSVNFVRTNNDISLKKIVEARIE